MTPAPYALGQNAQTDSNIQAQLQNDFKKYKNLQISVKNGVVDLEGNVNDFATKEQIDNKAHRTKNVLGGSQQSQDCGRRRLFELQLRDRVFLDGLMPGWTAT